MVNDYLWSGDDSLLVSHLGTTEMVLDTDNLDIITEGHGERLNVPI